MAVEGEDEDGRRMVGLFSTPTYQMLRCVSEMGSQMGLRWVLRWRFCKISEGL